MAKATDVIGKCQRCFGGQVPAVRRVRFNFDGVPYETLLCHNHFERIRDDMLSWIRTATELGAAPVEAAPAVRPARLIGSAPSGGDRAPIRLPRIVSANVMAANQPGQRTDTGAFLPAASPAAESPAHESLFTRPNELRHDTIENWQDGFTDHALERMQSRQVSVTQVLRCIQATGKTRRCPSKPGGDPDTALYEFEDVRVVVNERTNSILTVARPSDDLFQSIEAV